MVDACAALFFNVIGRRGESAFFGRVVQSLTEGRDPVSGELLPPSHARLLAAAPALSLVQLGWVIGFRNHGDTLVSLSVRLLSELDAIMRRRAGGPLSAAAATRRNSREFARVLRIAAAVLGKAGAADHPLLEIFETESFKKSLESARKQSLEQTRRMIKEDAGESDDEVEKMDPT